MFRTGFLSIIRSLVLYTQQQVYVIHTGYADCLLASSQHNLYLLVCVQCQTPDDGQRNCPKHVEFYSKNKLEKLVHLVGFIIRIYHDARFSECQIRLILSCSLFAIFFPTVRNDVLLVIQDLGLRSVTSDFHSRSQTIPCEICDRCHCERFCARNTSLLSCAHPSTNTRYALVHPPPTLYKHNK